jgi:integrase
VKIVFAVAVEDGDLQRNPAQPVRVNITAGNGAGRSAVEVDRVRALTREELERFLAALPTDRDRLLFRALVALGLRIGELQELRFKDIEFGPRPVVHVRRQYTRRKGHGVIVSLPKTRYGLRDVPLAPKLAAELEALGGDPDDLVFPAAQGGYLDRPNYGARVLKPAARKAGVEWVSFHTFRHTCASFLFATPREADDAGNAARVGGGKNVKQVQEWLGHADPGFTLARYVHLLDDGVGGADFFDDLL